MPPKSKQPDDAALEPQDAAATQQDAVPEPEPAPDDGPVTLVFDSVIPLVVIPHGELRLGDTVTVSRSLAQSYINSGLFSQAGA